MFLNWSEQDDPVAWANYYVLVAAAAGSKAKTKTTTSTRKRQASQSLTNTTPTPTQSSPLAQASAVSMPPLPGRYLASHRNNSDSLAAARAISTSPATSDLQPQRKRPRLPAALYERRAQHQQEREAASAYFRQLQDKLDREKAQRAAELEARHKMLQAEQDAAEQAYAEAAAACEAWISKCAAAAATARIGSDDTGAAVRELAGRLTELVAEYAKAEWQTLLGTYDLLLSTAESVSDDADPVSGILDLPSTC